MDLSSRPPSPRTITAWAALGILFALTLVFLHDAVGRDRVLISSETLQRSLPWAAVMEAEEPHNRFIGDQARIFYPYLIEAARVYAGEADALWTTRGGGGQPFLGNMTSALFHPLTALAGVLPMRIVPLLQGLLVLLLSSFFTFLFLRRVGLGVAASLFGAVAFGFGGHQVLWLQYALSHTLMALPFCFWATERLQEDRSARRVVVLAFGFALLVVAGHPETAYVSGAVAGLWALYRLWDPHGRSLVIGAVLLAVAMSAVQWWPFLDYALSGSHGLHLRKLEAARDASGVTIGAGLVYGALVVLVLAMLRGSADRGILKKLVAISFATIALIVARRMGMAVSGAVMVMPELYGTPVGGGEFTGAQDFPGLNAGYVGVLPVLLLAVGFLLGIGRGFVRFFGWGSLVLWGAAYKMPLVESVVRMVPGFADMGPTRLLGPVAFMAACGGAIVLEELAQRVGKPGVFAGLRRMAVNLGLVVVLAYSVLGLQTDPHGGRTIVEGVVAPDYRVVHGGTEPIEIAFHLDEPVDQVRVLVDRRSIGPTGPHEATTGGAPITVTFAGQRAEEGRHRLVVETVRDGQTEVLADQPLSIRRQRHVSRRDLFALIASLVVFAWLVTKRRGPPGAVVALALVTLDVGSFGYGYNAPSAADRLYPPTQTTTFLTEQPGPFRIFTEGTVLPPDTNYAVGVDHILSYDNIGYHRTWQWLPQAGVTTDHFATFTFSRENVDYGNPRFDTIDVRYVVTGPESDLSDVPGMVLVHESECRVWENTDNLGRVYILPETMSIGRESVDALAVSDPRRVGVLERSDEPPLELGGTGTATIVEYAASAVSIDVETDGPALLVFAENLAAGWEVSVNGGDFEPPLHCNVSWQAVVVPAGSSRVEFRYDPASWRWGSRLSILALVLSLWWLRPRRSLA